MANRAALFFRHKRAPGVRVGASYEVWIVSEHTGSKLECLNPGSNKRDALRDLRAYNRKLDGR